MLGCGRPLIIVPISGRVTAPETVFVAWKETPEAARAVAAAMPILSTARQVVLAHVGDEDFEGSYALDEFAARLRWHDIAAEVRSIPRAFGRFTSDLLLTAAAEVRADLIVMGGYGHNRFRELVLGGVTDTVLRDASLPVFVLH